MHLAPVLKVSILAVNVTRYCLPTGHWDWTEATNYSACQLKLNDENRMEEGLGISVLIYLIGKLHKKCQYQNKTSFPGYSVSLSALLGAVVIFLLFRWDLSSFVEV